jgi:hypothetical protein
LCFLLFSPRTVIPALDDFALLHVFLYHHLSLSPRTQDPALPLDPQLCAPMQPILRVLAQLDNAYVRQDAAASTTTTSKTAPAPSASSSAATAATAATAASAATAAPETIAIAPVPKKKTVFSLTSSSESLLHYYPTRRTLRLLLSAIDVRYEAFWWGCAFALSFQISM